LRHIGQDFTLAWRRLCATPTYFVFAVATLSVSFTAVVTIHAVLAFFIWRPAVIDDPERLLQVFSGTRSMPVSMGSPMSWADWQDFQRDQSVFSSVTAGMRHQAAVTTAGEVRPASGEGVTSDYFSTLGVRLLAGRPFVADDHAPGADPAIVIADSLARRTFGSVEAAIGRSLSVSGRPFTVVGVTPKAFFGLTSPMMPSVYWVPLEQLRTGARPLPAAYFDPARRQVNFLMVRGRLRPGVSLEQAHANASAIGDRLEGAYPSARRWPSQSLDDVARVWTAQAPFEGEGRVFRQLGLAIMTGVLLVLVMACTNLANLGFSRSAGRLHELGVRRALGASRWRLIREQLAESVVVVCVGLIAAWVLARWALTSLHMEVPVARNALVWLEPTVTPTVAGVAMFSAMVAIFVSGVWPALRSSAAARLPHGPQAGGARTRWRLQKGLVLFQVAGSVALLLTTVSAVDAVARGTREPGIDLAHLGLVTLDYGLTPRDEGRRRATHAQVLERAHQVPGVDAAAVADQLPFGLGSNQLSVCGTEQGFTAATGGVNAYVIRATDQYWDALGIPLLHGRALSADDVSEGRAVAVISRSSALEAFGTEQAVGRRAWLVERTQTGNATSQVEIVGVAGDTDVFTMGSRRSGTIVRPLVENDRAGEIVVVVKTTNPDDAGSALRSIVRSIDPELAVGTAGSGWSKLAGPFYVLNVFGWVSSALGIVTLLLVMTGLYGVLSTAVAHRHQEMAIRMALGSPRGWLVRRVVREGGTPVLIGLVLGIGAGLLARVAVDAILPLDLGVVDPFALLVVPLVVAVATAAATYLPARRAARVDPNVALRQQ
jgi:predicted permease